MSALSYIIATSHPHALIAAGFVAGVIVSNVVGLVLDAVRAARSGVSHG